MKLSALRLLVTGAFCSLVVGLTAVAQPVAPSVPTLTPPTLVPTPDRAGASEALLAESAIARVQREGRVRVGLLYNEPPFGELNIRGDVAGFDANLARGLAEAWGVIFEPVQVTRQTALERLQSGVVDMLVAAQVHRRELDAIVEFSHTYFPARQAMFVRADDGAAALADMANRRIGVVMGTPAETAAQQWVERSGLSVSIQSYYTLDLAIVALLTGEIDGLVENNIRLGQGLADVSRVRALEPAVQPEPYAIVVRRQDVNWRNLINRTLQYLVKTGRMNQIHQSSFLGTNYPAETLALWAGLGEEAPRLDQYSGDVLYPAQYALPRAQATGRVRVAGLPDLPPDAPASSRRLDEVNRALVSAMAARWGWQVEFVPANGSSVDQVANGQADLAVGVRLDWDITDRVDLTGYYLLHGERLLAEVGSPFETFNDLRGRWVGVFAEEPGAADRVNALAESVNTAVRVFTINNEQDAVANLLDQENADVIFGDSLKLIPLVEANPERLRLTTRGDAADPWYSRVYLAFAVPRNDLDFRLLVEYTLQELVKDGTWAALVAPAMPAGELPSLDIWPGPSNYLGIELGS